MTAKALKRKNTVVNVKKLEFSEKNKKFVILTLDITIVIIIVDDISKVDMLSGYKKDKVILGKRTALSKLYQA